VLMSEADGGTIISARCQDDASFVASNIVEGVILPAGEYILFIDPIFSDSTPYAPEYRKVIVDVYCAQDIRITPREGDCFELLVKGLTKHAETIEDGRQ
jgi:hypothetical protein